MRLKITRTGKQWGKYYKNAKEWGLKENCLYRISWDIKNLGIKHSLQMLLPSKKPFCSLVDWNKAISKIES